jgi:hypothetical protein
MSTPKRGTTLLDVRVPPWLSGTVGAWLLFVWLIYVPLTLRQPPGGGYLCDLSGTCTSSSGLVVIGELLLASIILLGPAAILLRLTIRNSRRATNP